MAAAQIALINTAASLRRCVGDALYSAKDSVGFEHANPVTNCRSVRASTVSRSVLANNTTAYRANHIHYINC